MASGFSSLDAMNSDDVVAPRRRVEDPEMDITPMIDITFLLLIFFLVAARIDSQAVVSLPPAEHGELVSAKNSIILTVVKKGDEVRIYQGDGIPSSTDGSNQGNGFTIDQVEQIRVYIKAGLEGTTPFQHPMTNILIKAQRDLKQRDVDLVLKAASLSPSGEPLSISQVHVAVLEQ